MILHCSELGNNLRLIKLEGRLDIIGSAEIEHTFAACCAVDNTHVIVDLSDVEFLTSSGMGLLVANARALAKRGGRMLLVSPAPHVKDTLEVSGVGAVIPVYASLESARSALLAS